MTAKYFSVFDNQNEAALKKEFAQPKPFDAEKCSFRKGSNEKKQVVNKKHPFWRAVYVRLNEGLVEKGSCDHSFDVVEQILMSLSNVDVGGTIDFYMENGGYCDCEILFNVYSDAQQLKKSGWD